VDLPRRGEGKKEGKRRQFLGKIARLANRCFCGFYFLSKKPWIKSKQYTYILRYHLALSDRLKETNKMNCIGDTNQLVESILTHLQAIGTQNSKAGIQITLEAIAAQNQFILSLWQTFLTVHFAITAALFSYSKPIHKSLSIPLACAYVIGVYINGNSLFDAYKGLEAIQDDIIYTLANPELNLKATKSYFEHNIGFPSYRSKFIYFIYPAIVLATLIGLYKHTRIHSNKEPITPGTKQS